MANEHSPLGASSAERWLNCPKSYGLIKAGGYKDDGSPHAALGTAGHKLAEICLDEGKDTWEYVGGTVEGFFVGDGEDNTIDANAVQVYLDFVRSLPGKHAWEVRLGNKWKPHPLYFGTADFVAVSGDSIDIADYKNGAGIVVDAEGNDQLRYYAIGALKEQAPHLPDTARVSMHIVQPRGGGAAVKTWTITVGELRQWSREVLVPGMLRAEKGEGEFTPGEWCRFCPAILDCPKQHQDLKTLNQADAEKMTDEELDLLYPTFETVKMFMKAAEARLMKRAMEGATFSQVKLVAKRAKERVWKEGADAILIEQLGDDAYTKKLLSPAQAEKLSQKWKDFVKEWGFLPEGNGYNLVPASHPGLAANPAADLNKEFGHFVNKE